MGEAHPNTAEVYHGDVKVVHILSESIHDLGVR
jgi:hypothetical protein